MRGLTKVEDVGNPDAGSEEAKVIVSMMMMIIIMCGAEGCCRIIFRQSGGILVRGGLRGIHSLSRGERCLLNKRE